ncbi:MAG: phage holin family protein [Clostridia bacterium]|nr:phage holin family protein [Clostridia bacterium]
MKTGFCTAIGFLGSAIASLFGGWSTGMTTLLVFMAIDYISGIIVAGVFHKSAKSATGALESRAGLKGLCRKCFMLLMVLVAARLDVVMELSIICNAVIIAFITNETISIIENAGLMGIPIPSVLTRAIEVLKSKAESDELKDGE